MSEQDRIAASTDASYRPTEPGAPPGCAARPDDGDEYRTMALVAWALLLAGLVTFIAGVAAVVVAYVKRGDAPTPWRSHYDATIRMFWIWFLLTLIGTPLIWLFGLGFIVLAVATVWTAVVGVGGLMRAAENRPAA